MPATALGSALRARDWPKAAYLILIGAARALAAPDAPQAPGRNGRAPSAR